MKELSIKEKAKAYDEVRTKIKMRFGSNVADEIFSEFEESEDERIRKVLVNYFKSYKNQCTYGSETFNGISTDNIIAWLEKQGEQKLTVPKWRYKNDNTPLLRDSLILNKYGCVGKSPSGALVNDVWVMDYGELAKLPKEEIEKQGEQKPTEEYNITGISSNKSQGKLGEIIKNLKTTWSEKDEVGLANAMWAIEQARTIAKDENDMGNLWYAERWLKSLKDRVQPQPKQEWGEEDTKMFVNIKACLRNANKDYSREVDWLKSIKPQPKNEWSEEDEDYINDLIKHFSQNERLKNTKEDIVIWLKSLKPQKQWKPSKEQMEALWNVYEGGEKQSALASLYNDLKKF